VQEHDALRFLLALAALLGTARVVGELGRKLGLPLVVGEILAGILLGPTVLSRIVPDVGRALFQQPGPARMLAGYTTLAVVLLLVVAGLEVDLGIVRRRGREALFASTIGMLAPLAGGLVLGFMLPDSDMVAPDKRVLFAVFLGVALSISALPVIAKTLLDLGLFKTELGLVVMSAAMLNDLVGWLAFSILVGPMQGGTVDVRGLSITVGLTAAFAVGLLTVGRGVLDRLLARMGASGGGVVSLVIVLALVAASITQALGVHAVLGGFIMGVAIGDSSQLRERTRATIHDFVTSVFAPVFFASLGLRVDFFHAFDLRLCVLVFAIASVTKVVGCTLGAKLGGFNWREASAVGFGLNARGAMEIILALLALEAGLIREQVFVALVVMAIGTSLVSGPAMKRLLYTREEERVVTLLRRGVFVHRLGATHATAAIEELIAALAPKLGALSGPAQAAVIEREQMAPTGLGDGVAVPHAQIEGLAEPVLALGLSPDGVDFDAPDGRPATFVFLLLLVPDRYEDEIQILASIARAAIAPEARAALAGARSLEDAARVLADAAKRVAASRGPRSPTLADI
jgi:Kef-type K+ transport system membrane component KefB/mannitol/fructose-specific phosphotransferase system IIA component (Ntr-type)